MVAALTGGVLSWFASANPDGLEWSIFHTFGKEELEAQRGMHQTLAAIQEKTAILPGYGFKAKAQEEEAVTSDDGAEPKGAWPGVSGGTTVSGLVGGLFTLLLAGLIGYGLRLIKKRA